MVTIIVPVYNVKEYLCRCVDSIIKQTYKDIDVVLVDDGSTDGSERICDELSVDDTRVRVIHKPNGGLSSARNAGIEAAHGEYIMFVDSDDWLHPRMVELLHDDMSQNDAEMAMCGFIKTSCCHEVCVSSNSVELIPPQEAIPRMLKGEWISAWAKLYRRELWQSIRFPEGLNNEDYAILVQIFDLCTRMTYRADELYYYFMREGSICRSGLTEHSFDEFQTGQLVLAYCHAHHPQWEHLALFNLTASIIKLTGECITGGKYLDRYEKMREYYLAHKSAILKNPALGVQYKPFLWCLGRNRLMHKLFVQLYYKWRH